MKRRNYSFWLAGGLALLSSPMAPAWGAEAVKHIVLIAGPKSHGPGEHDYLRSAKLIKASLDQAPNLSGFQTSLVFNGWPDYPEVLDRADTIVILSDGEDQTGPKLFHAPFMTDERMGVLGREMRRGCGLMTFHFATFSSQRYAPQILEWTGGYFDLASGHGEGGFYGSPNYAGHRLWHSAIRVVEADFDLCTPTHPVCQGVSSFRLKDEFYYQLTFRKNDPRLTPIVRVPALSPLPTSQIVSWAVERQDGGRGFGFSPGHYLEDWQNDDFRKLILNAIVWTAGMAVPAGGVTSKFLNEDQVNQALLTRPIATLIASTDRMEAGARKATEVTLARALNSELPRFEVTGARGSEALETDLSPYRLVILYSRDGLRPGLSGPAERNLEHFLQRGGGLTIVYASPSAPAKPEISADAGASTAQESLLKAVRWNPPGLEGEVPVYGCRSLSDIKQLSAEEQRRIAESIRQLPEEKRQEIRRDLAELMFRVSIADPAHAAARDVPDYQATRAESSDDLDFDLPHPGPIHVIATVQSRGTGNPAPMAFASSVARARVYHLVVGTLSAAAATPKTVQLLRYGSLWAAGE